MSRVLHLEPFGGIAGDMLCAALIDLGADPGRIEQGLRGLGVEGWTLQVSRVMRGPFAARHFDVRLDGEDGGGGPPAAPRYSRVSSHDHSHDHDHGHSHSHDHGHTHDETRSWATIRSLIEAASLPPRAKDRALRVFTALAEAEGEVHGIPVEEVSFHEVGAVDSIIDIVGACLALEDLGIDRILCGPLPMGTGSTMSQHGRIPLPAPATLLLLKGWPLIPGRPGSEQVTPTGAALVAALAQPGPLPAITLLGVGHGAGTKDWSDHPNILRAVLGQEADSTSPLRVTVIEAQMDDLPGEHLPPLIEALLAAGALDALCIPVQMKKGRPGLLVQAICEPQHRPAVELAMLRHGSTFGLRHHEADRRVLRRWHQSVDTPWGAVRVKIGALDGEILQVAPEYEDVAAVARASDQPLPRVHWEALRAVDPGLLRPPDPVTPAPKE